MEDFLYFVNYRNSYFDIGTVKIHNKGETIGSEYISILLPYRNVYFKTGIELRYFKIFIKEYPLDSEKFNYFSDLYNLSFFTTKEKMLSFLKRHKEESLEEELDSIKHRINYFSNLIDNLDSNIEENDYVTNYKEQYDAYVEYENNPNPLFK